MDDRGRYDDDRGPVDFDSLRSGSVRGRVGPRSASETLQPERVPPPPPRSHAVRHPAVIFFNFLITVVVFAVLATGAAAFYAKLQFEQQSATDQQRTILVERGTALGDIADQLQRSGIISNRWVFWAGVKISRQEANLKAGEYLIPAHASMKEIMESMVSGKAILYSVTIPEGLTTKQILDRLRQDPVLVGDIGDTPPEGSLLPDTYKFTRGDTRQNVIARMRRERDRLVTEIWSRRVDNLPIKNADQLVVLASIVEKETAIADERSRVAAVYINRLARNMRLQSDPTVVYGVYGGDGKPADKPITRSDLDQQNPYNTYQNAGLPPGPIANPGRAALEAVANPSRTSELYFVADGTGGHVFAETFEDHQRNVQRWRTIEAKRRQADAANSGTAVLPIAPDPAKAPPVTTDPAKPDATKPDPKADAGKPPAKTDKTDATKPPAKPKKPDTTTTGAAKP